MRKKFMVLFLAIILFCWAFKLSADQEKPGGREYVQKTYFLKNVSADYAIRSLNVYIENHSTSGNVLSVTIRTDKIGKFEELLNKIDSERRRITFRIFTVIGGHDSPGEKITNKNLKKVLTELSEVLSIDSFRLDGIGSVTVMEGTSRNTLSLASKSGLELNLMLRNISVNTDKNNERSVFFEFQLFGYIESTTSIRENGYLVAGVSKIGKNGDSLILVINAEIE